MGRAGPHPPQAQRPHVYPLHGAPGGLGPHLILTQELKQLSSLLSVVGSLSLELDSVTGAHKLQGQEAEPEL